MPLPLCGQISQRISHSIITYRDLLVIWHNSTVTLVMIAWLVDCLLETWHHFLEFRARPYIRDKFMLLRYFAPLRSRPNSVSWGVGGSNQNNNIFWIPRTGTPTFFLQCGSKTCTGGIAQWVPRFCSVQTFLSHSWTTISFHSYPAEF